MTTNKPVLTMKKLQELADQKHVQFEWFYNPANVTFHFYNNTHGDHITWVFGVTDFNYTRFELRGYFGDKLKTKDTQKAWQFLNDCLD